MTIAQILTFCRQQGVVLRAEGERLKVLSEAGADLPPALVKALREHKKALLDVLQSQARTGIEEEPIKIVEDRSALPLSFAQERLWFLHKYLGPNAVYNVFLSLRLESEFDRSALEKSLNVMLARHESLRTRFKEHRGLPQQVFDQVSINLPLEELSTREALHNVIAAERRRTFDLYEDRLFQVRLLRSQGDDGAVLLINMHHIVSDAWSMAVFFRELNHCYRALSHGCEPDLDPLPIQYADFACWQRHWLSDGAMEAQLAFWCAELADLPALTDLPTDFSREDTQGGCAARLDISLPAALVEGLQCLGQAHNATLFMTLLSAFATLLARLSGQGDIAIGTPIANRHHRQTQSLVGFFANTLVIRHRLEQDPTAVQLLAATRERCLSAYDHQDLPFEALVEHLAPARSLQHSPLFQVMFALQNAPIDDVDSGDLGLTPYLSESGGPETGGSARFDLTLNLYESDTCVTGNIEYNSDLFEAATIARWLDHYQRLLAAMVASPEQRLSQLVFLSEAEQGALM
ncbi:condensation domain-containing protein, partial [Microbulbifer sp. 2201CG32-9]|uniref:condensation domain-containing protein n=1 Tax=Microbulbifer sp. 2201CG32-9 TaxID=3232309 RepID=UPI00345B830F